MAIPLTVGSNPEKANITKGSWIQIFSSINNAVVRSVEPDESNVYLTYKISGDPAPIDLESQPIWQLHTPPVKISDGITTRDVYVYSVNS